MTTVEKFTEDRLERPCPEYDPCFMPIGSDLCCLPGTHSDSCVPAPVGYPPLITIVVER